jgi:hypothetical protein
MWQAPSQRIRAIQNAKKRQQDRLKRPMHIRKVRVEVKLTGGTAEQPLTDTQLLLNDLTPAGIGLYAHQCLPAGQELTITVAEPHPISLRGKVVWCQEIHSQSHVISNHFFSHRVGIKFLFNNEEERQAAEQYCSDLSKNYLYSHAMI